MSDPHYDFQPSLVRDAVLKALNRAAFDVVACSGDIANNEADCAEFLGWFSDVKVPKFLVPGNHDLWWIRKPRTSLANAVRDGFGGHAARAGWITPDPEKPWQVVKGVLLFNVFYTPNPVWEAIPRHRYTHGNGANDLHYSADGRNMFHFRDLVFDPPIPTAPGLPEVQWSMSHLSPNDAIPSRFAPQVCFVNNRILDIARVHRSPLHLFGHTHEVRDAVVGGIRCVNRSWMNGDYQLDLPAEIVVVHDLGRNSKPGESP